jgi:hypothetical protein
LYVYHTFVRDVIWVAIVTAEGVGGRVVKEVKPIEAVSRLGSSSVQAVFRQCSSSVQAVFRKCSQYEALFYVLLFFAFSTFPMFPIPCFWSARLALFSRFRVFAALLPIQVPIIGPDRQGAFRCMGIRGQEFWAGPHRQPEETPEERLWRHLRRRRRHCGRKVR